MLKTDRLGKFALLAAMTDENEEAILKESLTGPEPAFRLAITFVTGLSNDIKRTFVKNVVNCAIQKGIIRRNGVEAHAVVHAALDALDGLTHHLAADSSLKIKVAIGSDSHWVAVALYGDSAFLPLTNHERASLSVMHLGS